MGRVLGKQIKCRDEQKATQDEAAAGSPPWRGFDVIPERVERINVRLEESCDRICNILAPRTGLEAKFSLRLAAAMGIAGLDTGRLSTYSEEVAADHHMADEPSLQGVVVDRHRPQLAELAQVVEMLIRHRALELPAAPQHRQNHRRHRDR